MRNPPTGDAIKPFGAHISRFERVAMLAGCMDDREHDPWGEAMHMFFGVASVLDMTDVEGDVTPGPFARWDYRRASAWGVPAVGDVAARAEGSEGEWADDYTYAQIQLAFGYVEGAITQADLVYAGDVLHKYACLLERAGKNY